MLKGLAITPPVVGRISIGRVVEKNGKRLPEKDDQFTLTTQVQNRDGWVLHPLDQALRKDRKKSPAVSAEDTSAGLSGSSTSTGTGAAAKLRTIPVRVLFDDPDLNLRAEFSAFDKHTGRPVCVGNGDTCRRVTPDGDGTASLPCPSPEACEFGHAICKPYGRLNVLVGDDDGLGSFIFRTTSFNSIRTLAARLRYFGAVSGGRLASMPLELKLRGKSTTQSYRAAIYYVDLVVRDGATLEDAVRQARELDGRRKDAGFDQAALDEAARLGFGNGAFEDSPEEAAAVVEEFYPGEEAGEEAPQPIGTPPLKGPARLREKLEQKL